MAPLPSFSSLWTQIFPPKPDFTEKDLPDLNGKVYLVTGANTGVGKHLAAMLFSKNAKVYISARSESNANKAIQEIQAGARESKGSLVYLHLDLADFASIQEAVLRFTSVENKLHVLFNNAGVQTLNRGSPTKQGYETHLGVNVLGTYLLTRLLTPTLIATATKEPPGTVRVVWVSSSGTEIAGEKSVGFNPVDASGLEAYEQQPAMVRYGLSKAGNWLHGVEFARRYQDQGIVSIPLNPGNLASDLYHEHGFVARLLISLSTYPAQNGACCELFAGLSPQVTMERTGEWGESVDNVLKIENSSCGARFAE